MGTQAEPGETNTGKTSGGKAAERAASAVRASGSPGEVNPVPALQASSIRLPPPPPVSLGDRLPSAADDDEFPRRRRRAMRIEGHRIRWWAVATTLLLLGLMGWGLVAGVSVIRRRWMEKKVVEERKPEEAKPVVPRRPPRPEPKYLPCSEQDLTALLAESGRTVSRHKPLDDGDSPAWKTDDERCYFRLFGRGTEIVRLQIWFDLESMQSEEGRAVIKSLLGYATQSASKGEYSKVASFVARLVDEQPNTRSAELGQVHILASREFLPNGRGCYGFAVTPR